ncbi:MAG: ArnT family glycosyltransferase [Anaerolineae bacterium]
MVKAPLSSSAKCTLMGLAWLAAALRFPALFTNTFHADEALFATWARLIAVWRDPLLLAQPVDKPPLLFYSQALFYPLFGPVAWAARLPALFASLCLVPLTGLLAWRLYRSEVTAVLTSLVIALLPLSIQFSATAFIDPLLAALLAASLALAAGSAWGPDRQVNRAGWSGFWLGLAVLTKHQAWLFLPLVVGVGALAGWRGRAWRHWLWGLAPPLVLAALWSWLHSGGLTLWGVQLSNFGGIRPVWSWELWPRLQAWVHLWRLSLGSRMLAGLLAISLPLLIIRAWRKGDQAAAWDLLFLTFIMGYSLLHWLLAIPIWDRYWLPLMPLAALLVARTGTVVVDAGGRLPARMKAHSRAWAFAALVVLLVLQWPSALRARAGGFPIGGQVSADHGTAALSRALADAAYGTVLYDHWYSWQWRYHLFDKRVYVSWFPDPAALVRDVTAFGGDGSLRYVALPQSQQSLPVLRMLREAGFSLETAAVSSETTLYLIKVR